MANAAYFQDWSHADIRFQKMTILVAERAQDPAALKATKLITISRDTMTVVSTILIYTFMSCLLFWNTNPSNLLFLYVDHANVVQILHSLTYYVWRLIFVEETAEPNIYIIGIL